MLIDSREERGVFWIVLNRPEKANAVNLEMWKEIATKLDQGAASSSSSMIAITGSGRYFSAGEDISDLSQASTYAAAFELFVRTLRPVFDRILESPKPVVAAVNGPAIGAGAELTFLCDFTVAHPSAFFALAQGKNGIGPALGLTFGVGMLGRKRLAEMAMTGRRISAAEAERWGLVNTVAENLETEVERLAQQVSETPPALVRAMKEVLLRQVRTTGYDNAFDDIAMFSQSPETRAGTKKFLTKSQ